MLKIYPDHPETSCKSCLKLSLGSSVFRESRGHVISLARAHLKLPILTLLILRLNTDFQAVHATVVDLILCQRETKTVARRQVPNNLRQSRTVIFHAPDL